MRSLITVSGKTNTKGKRMKPKRYKSSLIWRGRERERERETETENKIKCKKVTKVNDH